MSNLVTAILLEASYNYLADQGFCSRQEFVEQCIYEAKQEKQSLNDSMVEAVEFTINIRKRDLESHR